MINLFSERNNLIESITNNEYDEGFRSAIVTCFFNQYNSLQEGELFGRHKDVMDVFGIIHKLNDVASHLSNKENTLQFFKKSPWNTLFDFVEYVLSLDDSKKDNLANKYNIIFRVNGCPYRVVNYKVIPIVNDIEIKEMGNATNTGIGMVKTGIVEKAS